jgi:hypothetical protein
MINRIAGSQQVAAIDWHARIRFHETLVPGD